MSVLYWGYERRTCESTSRRKNHAATGELVRQLTLDPSRTYQPTGNPRRANQKTP